MVAKDVRGMMGRIAKDVNRWLIAGAVFALILAFMPLGTITAPLRGSPWPLPRGAGGRRRATLGIGGSSNGETEEVEQRMSEQRLDRLDRAVTRLAS